MTDSQQETTALGPQPCSLEDINLQTARLRLEVNSFPGKPPDENIVPRVVVAAL